MNKDEKLKELVKLKEDYIEKEFSLNKKVLFMVVVIIISAIAYLIKEGLPPIFEGIPTKIMWGILIYALFFIVYNEKELFDKLIRDYKILMSAIKKQDINSINIKDKSLFRFVFDLIGTGFLIFLLIQLLFSNFIMTIIVVFVFAIYENVKYYKECET